MRRERGTTPVRPRGILRFENFKQLVTDKYGNPFEGWTPIVYVSVEEAKHLFRDARAIVRFALPAHGGDVLARFYIYAHSCPPPRRKKRVGESKKQVEGWGDGGRCPSPEPTATGDLVVEMERVLGRQIKAIETLLPPDVAKILMRAGSLLGRIETVRTKPNREASSWPYSKIAEIGTPEWLEKHSRNASGQGKVPVAVPVMGTGTGDLSYEEPRS